MGVFRNPSQRLASLCVFFSASLWGLYWVPLRWLESKGIPGAGAVALLSLPAALVLGGYCLWHWRRMTQGLGATLLIGLFTGLGFACYAVGLMLSSVVKVTLLFYLTPVWSTLIGLCFLSESVHWQRWLAIGLGLLGLLCLLSGDELGVFGLGDVMGLLSGIFWAVGAALIKHYGERLPVLAFTFAQFVVTVLCAVLLGYFLLGESWPSVNAVGEVAPVVLLIAFGVLLPSVLLLFWAQRVLFPGRAGLLMMSEVMVAVISASVLLPEEQLSMLSWLGAALIVSACFVEVLLGGEETENRSMPNGASA